MNHTVDKISFLDKPMRNFVHYGLCFVGAKCLGHKLVRCSCNRCPFMSCQFRVERRQEKITVKHKRRRDDTRRTEDV